MYLPLACYLFSVLPTDLVKLLGIKKGQKKRSFHPAPFHYRTFELASKLVSILFMATLSGEKAKS